MSQPRFDRSRVRFRPLSARRNKFEIDKIRADPSSPPPPAGDAEDAIARLADRVQDARSAGNAVILCHGAHLIKNGASSLIQALVDGGWVAHVATNGAGSIHDWEFAFQGASCEDVRAYAKIGQFGTWDETGRWCGAALHVGALAERGFGESIGHLIGTERLVVPEPVDLIETLRQAADRRIAAERGGAAADLLQLLDDGLIDPGTHVVPHPWKSSSIQATCHERGVPFTVHPGIGQDIVYTHPAVRGSAVGRAALADFLAFAASIERLEGGVFISCGSSVMSPMIFEKSISMARNVILERGERLDDFLVVVNDLAPVTWNWAEGEPPLDHPAYYVRFCKTFSRMGGELLYVGIDNRAFLHNLLARLEGR